MRTFLALFMLLKVSADENETKTINGLVGRTVLLPCNCSGINLTKDHQWQMGETDIIFKYNKSSNPDGYGSKGNCSLTLTNIKVKDQGKYRCCFHTDVYVQLFVFLNVSESPPHSNGLTSFTTPSENPEPPGPQHNRKRSFIIIIIIPVLLALCLALFLYHQIRFSKHVQKRTKETTESV